MFFRTKIVKDTPLVQLVEACRNAEGQLRQRVVASLGDASIPEAGKKSIACAVEDRLGDQADLLDDCLSPEAAVWVDRIPQVIGRSKSSRPAQSDTSRCRAGTGLPEAWHRLESRIHAPETLREKLTVL